jgi:hypothetical protein
MVRSLKSPLAGLLLLLLAGCGTVDPTGGLPAGDAQLAVINSLPEGTIASLLLDDASITLPAAGTRISRVIPAGSHRLEARAEGGRVIASTQFAVSEGGRRTAIVGGSVMGPTVALMVGADTASLPVGDAIKVRVVHSVVGTPTLEAWLAPQGAVVDSAARLISPFDYGVGLSGEFPGYVVRPPGTYRVRITNMATGALQAEGLVAMEAGQVWSVILTRRADGELELVPVQEH